MRDLTDQLATLGEDLDLLIELVGDNHIAVKVHGEGHRVTPGFVFEGFSLNGIQQHILVRLALFVLGSASFSLDWCGHHRVWRVTL